MVRLDECSLGSTRKRENTQPAVTPLNLDPIEIPSLPGTRLRAERLLVTPPGAMEAEKAEED